jgi:hypothetical protein
MKTKPILKGILAYSVASAQMFLNLSVSGAKLGIYLYENKNMLTPYLNKGLKYGYKRNYT